MALLEHGFMCVLRFLTYDSLIKSDIVLWLGIWRSVSGWFTIPEHSREATELCPLTPNLSNVTEWMPFMESPVYIIYPPHSINYAISILLLLYFYNMKGKPLSLPSSTKILILIIFMCKLCLASIIVFMIFVLCIFDTCFCFFPQISWNDLKSFLSLAIPCISLRIRNRLFQQVYQLCSLLGQQ